MLIHLRELSVRDTRPSVRSLTRYEKATGAAIFAGLIGVLAVAAVVLVDPGLVDDLVPYWPPLSVVGLLSTAAGFWWLWRRPW